MSQISHPLELKDNTVSDFSFSNTSIAFQDRSDEDLKKARLMFSAFNYKWVLKVGPSLARFGINAGLPIKGIIKDTLFTVFCGGESIEDCAETVERLNKAGIGTILDYSVEGQENEASFDATTAEIVKTIEAAARQPDKIPYAVFKVTGIARLAILEKASRGEERLSGDDLAEYQRIKARFMKLTGKAHELGVSILVDAEETWIQATIDNLAEIAMEKFNKERCIVFNTLQFYRHDRISYLENRIEHARENGYFIGYKLVRGAYMEKERLRAYKRGYPSPIQRSKAESDHDFDEGLLLCITHLDRVSICCGTHNEQSCKHLTQLMKEKGVAKNDKRIYFAQLLGMSDHISYNLAHAGYNVAKYVPYGPLIEVLPYLSRRAEENSSVKGQAGRELSLINAELKRRNQA
ncbi:MAG: proline dehydrogenase family protein [Bacteroidia bacterium]